MDRGTVEVHFGFGLEGLVCAVGWNGMIYGDW